ncbi:thioesterase family protein [Mycolicibacterium sp. P1-5]|uniref:thioesterase family protein n=1 Tax=Mycolicibacterium sp. P1-5 TaxID=2024617 RepID=UPI0011F013F5|nr:thioesterase family protein [Mycolicibacterium sp. P1-5]KAA0107700.1 thioesterase family protein [Mycolicibacterium sp. P1-5]
MTDSYYELVDPDDPRGEKFRATDLVRSTWTSHIQHAGPVSALLVRALERCQHRGDTRLSRVVVDLLGPVPAEGDLWVTATVERSGKQIELVSAEMSGLGPDGRPRPVARASGWRMLMLDTKALLSAPVAPLASREQGMNRNLADNFDRNYVHSLEWLWLTDHMAPGPGGSWLRPQADLVQGEGITPLERLFAVADCANGIGSKIDIRKYTFLNTDLVVHLHRIPVGEWTGIRAETMYGPDGVGTTVGTLFDDDGAVGVIQQSVLVRPRP